MEGCRSKLLSQAGCAVLIKSMVQVMPMYAMSSVKMTKGLCKELDALVRRFWSSQDVNKNWTWCLLRWDQVNSPKVEGRMDLRNLTLLIKILLPN